ncbi:MAG: Omp28-related outer membrane protein [Sphingobacteriales bacterium]|nr:Omp28-related outer membrane protein [Sphingobacteriales bacterium]
MKKMIVFGAMLFLSFCVYSQNLVTTTPQFRNVVLEEFTGIHCGYCPDGHARAEALSSANPGRVVLINVHAGNFAVPAAGEPDFRTVFGDSLVANAKVTGYPQGSVNRHLFPEIDPQKMALGRTSWASAAAKIFPLMSPVNIGFKSTFDTSTRILTVEVQLFYVESSPLSENYLNVVLLENHVIGYQTDYANGNHTDYDHKHILRHMITGLWGDVINTTSKGTLVTKSYQYIVPAGYNIDNCDVAVFVTENKNEIYTGVQAEANGGSHDGKTALYIGDVINTGKKIDKGIKGNSYQFDMELLSKLSGDMDFKITMTHNAPAGWNVSFQVDGNWYSDSVITSLTGDVAKAVKIKIEPADTPAVVKVRLKMESITYPGVVREQTVYFMAGVTDLVISNAAPWGDGGSTSASDFKDNFLDGLKYAGNSGYASSNTDFLLLTENTNVLSSVKNIYYNVGWSFPAFTDNLVNIFDAFINNGGNLMVSGQDVGWDTWDANGNGTQITKDFYTNYLKANYISDGDQSNNQLNANTSDAVFGQTGSSQIVNVYGSNPDNGQPYMYPEVISALSDGQAIFYYNNTPSKVAAVRSRVTGFKTVYLGVSLEMISSKTMRNEIMKLTHDWFYGLLSDIEFDEKFSSLSDVYPNPAADKIRLKLQAFESSDILIVSMDGRTIKKLRNINHNQEIDVSDLPDGQYLVKVISEKECQAIPLMIFR